MTAPEILTVDRWCGGLDETAILAAFREDEPRDPHTGEWTRDGGGLLPKGPETPLPAFAPANAILDKWVTQGGSGKLTAQERDTLNATVGYYGAQVPAGLVRGEHDQPPSRYKVGKVITLAPASFSTEEESALPYAEAGDKRPAVLHVTSARGLKGLNVSGRAEREGFNEQEWVVAARFRVTGSHVDGEGITHVQVAYATGVAASRHPGDGEDPPGSGGPAAGGLPAPEQLRDPLAGEPGVGGVLGVGDAVGAG
jgi:hypothetical protein